jgi:hypothetical protein
MTRGPNKLPTGEWKHARIERHAARMRAQSTSLRKRAAALERWRKTRQNARRVEYLVEVGRQEAV